MLFDAKTAREKTLCAIKIQKEQEICEVMTKIDLAASNGRSFAHIDEILYPETIQKLEELGYKVCDDFYKHGVSWEKK